MLRNFTSFALMMLALSTLALAEGDHSSGPRAPEEPAGTSRATGDADKAFKEKSIPFFQQIFPSVSKSYLTEAAEKLPDALVKVKDGNSQPMSDVLTPLFGTLNNDQFDKLMTDVDAKIKSEKATSGTVDNKFIDLLETVQRYGKVMQQIPDQSDDKKKAEATIFDKDFKAQQTKNKDFVAKVDKLKTLTKPEQKAERDALQKDILGQVNQKAALSFVKGQLDKGSNANKQFAKDLRDALATKTESGHNVIDTVWNGKTERLIYTPETADKAFEEYAKRNNGFAATSLAPSNHAQPNVSLSLNGSNQLVEAVPTGFKPPVVVTPPVAQPNGTQPNPNGTQPNPNGTQPNPNGQQGGLTVEQVRAAVADPNKCGKCHGSRKPALVVTGNDIKSLRLANGASGSPMTAAQVKTAIDNMGAVPNEAKTFLDQLVAAQR